MASGLIGDDAGIGTEFDGGKRSIELRMYSRIIDADAALSPAGEIEPQMREPGRSRSRPEEGGGNLGKLARLCKTHNFC